MKPNADALLQVLRIHLEHFSENGAGVLSASFAHSYATCHHLTILRSSSADGCFLVASGSGTNGARSTSWVFLKEVEQKRAGGAALTVDDSVFTTGLHRRTRGLSPRFFRGGSSLPTQPACRAASHAVGSSVGRCVPSPVLSRCVLRLRGPCLCTASDRGGLLGSARILHAWCGISPDCARNCPVSRVAWSG